MQTVCIFLATCLYVDPDVNLETALRLRPYDALIGIDKSLQEIYLESYQFLRLHAILHDASGFCAEQSRKCPGY